jgi:hypothetical protein
MSDPAFAANRKLRARLLSLAQAPHPTGNGPAPDHREGVSDAKPDVTALFADADPATPIHVVVTANEVNQLHGTGPLVKRLFQGRRHVLSIRARNDWGVHDFGDWNICPSPRPRNRAETFGSILRILRGRNVATVLCVPFLIDELFTSIAIHECFGAKLCVYQMDDQNIAVNNIPDPLMREFLERASLRLATHPELRLAYEQKYGLPFFHLPAIVPDALVRRDVAVAPESPDARKCALIGSFWDQSWFDRLCSVLDGSAVEIDWFGNNKSPWLDLSTESLARAGITPHGIVPEERLAQELAKYPFVIVPVGALDSREKNHGVASLSLPGRILFACAAAHVPVLIVGNERTCGARFVKHFGIGEVAPYDSLLIKAAMERMRTPESQRRMRDNAARIAPMLSDRGVSWWLEHSIEIGRPVDSRFEDLFDGYGAALDAPAQTVSPAGEACAQQ